MQLLVKKKGLTVTEYSCNEGSVQIGRHPDSHIVLADKKISRHHATIFSENNSQWFIKDLDSVNKTYLNEQPIQKSFLKTGDIIRITDFTIQVNIEKTASQTTSPPHKPAPPTPQSLEDTIVSPEKKQQLIIRTIQDKHAPEIKLPSKRLEDFVTAAEAIYKANGLDEILNALLEIVAKQFNPWHCWIALRDAPDGPMTCHAGKSRDSTIVHFNQIADNKHIVEALESGKFILVPHFDYTKTDHDHIHSAMFAPLACRGGCFGIIYIDNDSAHPGYDLSDLDYLMILAIHTAVVIENY